MDHADSERSTDPSTDTSSPDAPAGGSTGTTGAKRRRGSRGGQRRRGSGQGGASGAAGAADAGDSTAEIDDRNDIELPEPIREGRPSVEAAEKALVRKPRIGDTMPMPTAPPPGPASSKPATDGDRSGGAQKRRRRSGSKGGSGRKSGDTAGGRQESGADDVSSGASKSRRARGRGRDRSDGPELDAATLEQRRGRERNGKPIGRYLMAVQVRSGMTQVAVLEGRNLIEHYVSRPADDVSQIHGNIYVGRIQNVLPGMEAAFVDIATPKNAVLYRGDVQYDPEDVEEGGKDPRIEDILKNKQLITCQVTKNPIAHKGARLTQEVSLPGRFVVLIPNSKTYGISKRLPDDVRKRLRGILDRVKPDEHGLIVRTAAETATEDELVADMTILLRQWDQIAEKAAKTQRPALLYREPELAVRVIREEFNADYRGVVIDDERLYHEIREYVAAFNPELADRIEYYDGGDAEGALSVFEKYHIHEQVHKALDRKVWLPSGGSLIIEHTEALTVIDVNTGKNVGKSNLEETVFHNNMEAAEEIAKQLRLRDIGGIIVIDFIDMEVKGNRAKVIEKFRDALARDKTRSQVFDITELGLVEMTRKRIGEGLLTEYSEICPDCEGRGVLVDYSLLE
ncbi:MAG TPA: Rne/Rng family ribonuclease [Ilumatobacteraceae bacterium]|jgi:ribonuclease E|nr:Rne/Rng family ribonuclease [Ilumatobacteraceae bacterium]